MINRLHALISRLRRAVSLVWQSNPRLTSINLGLIIFQSVFPLLTLLLLKQVIDNTAIAATNPGQSSGAFATNVAPLLVLFALVFVLQILTRAVSDLVAQVQVQAVTDHVFKLIHKKSNDLDIEFYENASYHDALHQAQYQAASKPPVILNQLIALLRSSLSLLSVIGLILIFSPALVGLLVLATVPGVLLRFRIAEKTYNLTKARTKTERRAMYYNILMINPEFAKEIRLFDLGALFSKRFSELRTELRKEHIHIALWEMLSQLALQIVPTLAVIAALGFIAYQTVQGAITLGAVIMYYQAFQRTQGFLQEIFSNLGALYENSLFLNNLQEFLELKPKIAVSATPQTLPPSFQQGIVFEDVEFTYPNSEHHVLNGINLTLRPGEVIALVGSNGAGKTTLIKLLCRLYDPTRGKITIDGINLCDLNPEELRRQIAVIFQDYVHYHLSAAENIWVGDTTQPLDPERVKQAAQRAGIDETIQRLEQGYDTMLGRWFQDGGELSIGEWQKMALARAFYRDAQVIVLDEPTSAMDAEAEFELFSKFRALLKDKSAILISHRLSTVSIADRIYVLEHGKIVEVGNHAELMRQGQKYAYLFETQARPYREQP